MRKDPHDASGFVLLSDMIPHIVQEIRYFTTYNFIGEHGEQRNCLGSADYIDVCRPSSGFFV